MKGYVLTEKMKKNSGILYQAIILIFIFIMAPVGRVQAADIHTLEKEKDGVVEENGKLRFYKNGRKMKNKWGSSGKKKYYFGANGNAVTGVCVIKGKFFVFNSETAVYNEDKTKNIRSIAKYGKSFTALKKQLGKPKKTEYLEGSCYGDGKDGILTYKNFTVFTFLPRQGEEIFMGAQSIDTQGGLYYAYTYGTQVFYRRGLSSGTDLNKRIGKIVNKKTKKEWDQKKKLRRLFRYVEKKYDYVRKIGFSANNGWEKAYTEEMLRDKQGSCYHYAALFAFLAKSATGLEVRIGLGKTNGFSGNLQPHAWVEVKYNSKWYILDPNMDKYAANSSGKYFFKSRKKLKSVYDGYKNSEYFEISL